jgi:hypothetical protein
VRPIFCKDCLALEKEDRNKNVASRKKLK